MGSEMKRKRVERWQDEFWAALSRESASPFVWGSGDCVLKAARVADAIVVEPIFENAARDAFSWIDEATAIAAINSAGGLRAAIETVLGPAVDTRRLTQGDLLLCRTGSDEPGRDLCVAVHDGVSPMAFVGDRLRPLPWRLVECGWEV